MGSLSNYKGNPKNYIINGDFDIWQRGSSFTSGDNYYSADRWKARQLGGINFSVTRQTDTLFPAYMLQIKATSGAGSSGLEIGYQMEYEHFKSLLGKTVTLSMWVSSLTANITSFYIVGYKHTSTKDINIQWGANSAIGFLNQSKSVSTSPQIITHTFTIPSDSLSLSFVISVNGVTLANNDGLVFNRIWLNEGINPMPFQLFGGDINGEILACQRYCEKSYDLAINPGSSVSNGYFRSSCYANDAGGDFTFPTVPFIVSKRITGSTVSFWDQAGNSNRITMSQGDGTQFDNINNLSGYSAYERNFVAQIAVVQYRYSLGFHWLASCEF